MAIFFSLLVVGYLSFLFISLLITKRNYRQKRRWTDADIFDKLTALYQQKHEISQHHPFYQYKGLERRINSMEREITKRFDYQKLMQSSRKQQQIKQAIAHLKQSEQLAKQHNNSFALNIIEQQLAKLTH